MMGKVRRGERARRRYNRNARHCLPVLRLPKFVATYPCESHTRAYIYALEVSKPRNRKMKRIVLVAVLAGLVAAVALGMAQKSVDPAVLHAHLNSVHGEMLGE